MNQFISKRMNWPHTTLNHFYVYTRLLSSTNIEISEYFITAINSDHQLIVENTL